MKDLSNKPYGHFFYYQLVVFIGIIALIISRSPDLFWYPRFWAEEGTLYFKSIYENSWFEGLFFIPRYTAEYIALPVNIPLTIAAHFAPLEYATAISTYFSLFIMLIPFMIVLWGKFLFVGYAYQKNFSKSHYFIGSYFHRCRSMAKYH
jgi:hypothetical protein